MLLKSRLLFLSLVALAVSSSSWAVGDPLGEAESLLQAQRTRPDTATFERAKAIASAEVKSAPRQARAWTLLAWTQMLEHRFGAALESTRTAEALVPNDVRALGLMSDALVELGRYEEAVAVTQRLADRDPGIPAWTRAAHLRFLHGDLEGAIQLMSRAARAAPGRGVDAAWIRAHLARLHLHAGNLAAAAQAIAAAQQAYSDLPATLREQGRLHLARGDALAALESYRRALTRQPNAEDALSAWRIARELGQEGRVKHHGALLEGLARLDATGLSRRALAEYFAEAGQSDRALRLAREEFAARPDIFSHATLARVLARAGSKTEAKHHASAALALSTPDPQLQADMRAILGSTAARAAKAVRP